MKLLCITDPKTHPPLDATVALYNHFAEHVEIDFYHTSSSQISSDPEIKTLNIKKSLGYEDFLEIDNQAIENRKITDFDLVFSRADSPLPENYYENLSLVENKVCFVNRPSSVLKFFRKDEVAKIASQFMPENIVSRKVEEIEQFLNRHKVIVAKRNIGYGGKWVYKIEIEDNFISCENILDGQQKFDSYKALVGYLNNLDSGPYQFMRFLKNVSLGDKRIHVVNGEIYGAILRKSADSSQWLQNLTLGATAKLSSVSEFEKKVIHETTEVYRDSGIYTLGYDFLVDDDGSSILSEINSGNIGGYNRYKILGGEDVVAKLTSWLISFTTQK
ncbi:MAG: hypothetical protein R3A13_02685 [Bdellovibrionota bacterium]